MSEMAKNARAAMKAKATRMGGKGDPKAKVDASSWSPPEMMNTGAKVGMRPLSRRAFRKGGKVIEKCEGAPAAMRADRKQRKAGGRATSLVTDMINRNVKKANKYREGGDAHVGGYKSGGDVEQDKKLVKKAFRQHDEHMHGGKHEDIKLKKGGKAKRADGGKTDPNAPLTPHQMANFKIIEEQAQREIPVRDVSNTPLPPSGRRIAQRYKKGGKARKAEGGAMGRRINDTLNDNRSHKEYGYEIDAERRAPRALSPPFIRDRTDRSDPRALRDLERGDADAMIGVNSKESGMKKGGRTKKQVGGGMDKKAIPGDAPTRGYTPNGSSTDNYEDMPPPPKYGSIGELIEKKGLAKKNGGGTYYGGTRPTGGRMPRKSGGRAKGKTNISITINPQQPQDQQQQAMMPKMPTPPPMPPPPIAPPGMGPGMPPMPMPPPGGMPPGLAGAGGPPPGMPPMPRKRGGRAYRSYKDMDAGALGGMGRLEKVEIEHGKRVGRLSGGRARSYKDMDAGSLGGMGRIEKIAIQKHKR